MASAISAPIREEQRIKLLDCLRGFALLGILLMNSMAQSQSHFFYDKMDLSQPITGANFWAWVVECFLFEGTMRGLFSILFGAGTLLLLSKLISKNSGLQPADVFYRRMLWLLVFGLINAFIFLWPGDILYSYAICGLLLFPFRNLSSKVFLLIAAGFLLIGTYRENSDLYHYKSIINKGQAAEVLQAKKVNLTADQQEQLAAYQGFKAKTTQEGIAKQAADETRKIQRANYFGLFSYFLPINMMIESTLFYKIFWYDILLFLFIGMALYKNGFLTGKRSNRLYALVAIIGIAVGLTLNYYVQRMQYQLRFDQFLFTQRWQFSYYEIRRVFQTMGYLSLLILLYKIIPFRKLMNLLAPVGQMAFTNYLGQSIITSVIFYGFGLFGKLQRYEVYFVVVAIWLFQIVFSHLWLHFFRFGPFEWLWRSLTYLKKQPMKRKVAAEKEEEEEAGGEVVSPAIA